MYLRLLSNATRIAAYKTICVGNESVNTTRKTGKRLVTFTECFKLAEFPIHEPAALNLAGPFVINFHKLVNGVSKDESRTVEPAPEQLREAQAWIDKQLRNIDQAYRENLAQGLQGGLPVIKKHMKNDRKKWSHHSGFMEDSKIGEFSGVIRDAIPTRNRKAATAMMRDSLTIQQAWKDQRLEEVLDEVVAFVLKKIEDRPKGRNLADALPEKTRDALYIAERQLFYTITKRMGRTQTEYETRAKARAEAKFRALKGEVLS